MKGVVKDMSDIKLMGRTTQLSQKINIDGIYETSDEYPPVYFSSDGIIVFGNKTGVYRLMGNMIIANVYSRPTDFNNLMWEMNTLKFKIIDKDNVNLFSNILHMSSSNKFDILQESKMYHFFQTDEKPRTDNVIYKQKWLWEREEDWERWMSEHEQQ